MSDSLEMERYVAWPELFAGVVCLDFANTLEPRGAPAPYTPPASYTGTQHDYLRSYRDVVLWGLQAGIVERTKADGLIATAVQKPSDAAAVFAHAIRLREAIYRLFYLLAQHQPPEAADIELLTVEQRAAMQHARLVSTPEGFAWSWEDGSELARVIWPIVQSATTLLVEGDLTRIKVCPGVPGAVVPCAGVFYDASKNRVRTWCSMRDCGGTVKARRQNARRRRTP
jgi:predicted RNA-binding Zn ribbon-like protein